MIKDLNVEPNIVYIDGTKLEAYANKYTFVWKKSIQKFKDRLNLKITNLIPRLNLLLLENNYPCFIVKDVYRASEILDYIIILKYIIDKEGVCLVYKQGKKKVEVQKLFVLFEEYHDKMLEYEIHLNIIGENRNSYSKTDHDATFMRMKDDHMRNSQLKAGYNMQIAVASEYVMAIELYQDRSDFATFIPFLNHFNYLYDFYPEKPIADAGYGNFDNYKFCIENNIGLYQKYTMYSKEKEKKYKNNIFNKSNFKKDEDGNYICPNNKKLIFEFNRKMRHTKEEKYEKIYRCYDCESCTLKAKCTTSKIGRTITMNEEYESYRKIVRTNLNSVEGIYLRVNRSIQVEGAIGIMKENMKYRSFNRRSLDKAKLEATLVSIGMNISKFHNRKYRVVQ